MKVAVDQINEQGLPLSLQTSQDPWLLATLADAGNFRAADGARVDLLLTRVREQIFVRGQVKIAMRGPCSRCADDIGFELDTAVDVTLVAEENQPKALDSGEIRSQDIDVGAYAGDEVDVGQVLHDEILLDMPSQVLCQEDCLGRCGACGANQNETACACADAISPVSPFASLAQLKKT